jgi:serine/threonine protein kinase
MSTPAEQRPDGTVAITRPPMWSAEGAAIPKRIGEFELVTKLGEGSFGQVYLARQASLGREVALKVFRGTGSVSEGQLLAGLEHDHIVKVYSAFVDTVSGVSGLCLQYVPGADLGVIIRRTFEGGRAPQSGRALLDALDALRHGEPGFDPAALRDREGLAGDDYAQAVCRLGGQLAEALAVAHAHGILHCDIKPGNILMTPYGRPMLADFNVAFDRHRNSPGMRYGGTLAYMAPEYRAAVMGQPGGAADERCDIFALGVVLYELATGARPRRASPLQLAETLVPDAPTKVGPPDEAAAHHLAADERLTGVPRELVAVIRRCLEPEPARRYQTAGELASALAGARSLLSARRAQPAHGRVGRWVSAHVTLALVLAGVLPHVVASIAQIGYNAVEVKLDDPQRSAFVLLVLAYNLIAYPVCAGTGVLLMIRLPAGLARLADLSGSEVDALRAQALRLAGRVAVLGAVGWLPGGVLFPVGLDLVAGPVGWPVYGHFAVSFALAGLIGVVFSYLGVLYVVFRAVYPRLGNPDTHTPAAAAAEVRPLAASLGTPVVLACGVPLLGAVLLLALADEGFTFGFRLLVVMLIGVGAAGVGLAERIVLRLRELTAVWLNDVHER